MRAGVLGLGHFIGKIKPYGERLLDAQKNSHMFSDREIGPGRPTPARRVYADKRKTGLSKPVKELGFGIKNKKKKILPILVKSSYVSSLTEIRP